jgi:alpha-L-rhamnosidase
MYIIAEGNLMLTSQTGLGLVIRFGLCSENEEQRKTAGKALDRLVRNARFHISTSVAGTPVISHALSEI